MKQLKIIFKCIIFCSIASLFSCGHSGTQQKIPVENPDLILKNQLNFLSYWDNNVKLSLHFIAYDNNNKPISKEIFLQKLTTGNYLPLRLLPDSLFIYKLYKIDTASYPAIADDISASGKQHLQYFQMIGKPLPNYNFIDLNGNIFNPGTCKGKMMVINTWFIHCGTCVQEMPALNQLVNLYKSRPDIIFIGLALDPKDSLKIFLAKTSFDYDVVSDMEHYIIDTLKLNIFPTHILINKNGLVVNVTNDYDQMEYSLEENLK